MAWLSGCTFSDVVCPLQNSLLFGRLFKTRALFNFIARFSRHFTPNEVYRPIERNEAELSEVEMSVHKILQSLLLFWLLQLCF